MDFVEVSVLALNGTVFTNTLKLVMLIWFSAYKIGDRLECFWAIIAESMSIKSCGAANNDTMVLDDSNCQNVF